MKKRRYSEDKWSPEYMHRLGMLKDIYQGLLPPRQKQVISLKIEEDLSLAEISERVGISRQACDDAIKRCVRALEEYEAKLGFLEERLSNIKTIKEATAYLRMMTDTNWREKRDAVVGELEEIVRLE